MPGSIADKTLTLKVVRCAPSSTAVELVSHPARHRTCYNGGNDNQGKQGHQKNGRETRGRVVAGLEEVRLFKLREGATVGAVHARTLYFAAFTDRPLGEACSWHELFSAAVVARPYLAFHAAADARPGPAC